MEAIERLTDPKIVAIFTHLVSVNERYSTDDDFVAKYYGSEDEADFSSAVTFVETVACLARRKVIDPSLVVDAVGLTIRRRWNAIRTFIERRRRIEDNPDILNNFEWLAMYSTWWKDIPRPPHEKNYDPRQFAGLEFRV
jgi:hypothetical protein